LSISHAGQYAAVAVCQDCRVGIDVEQVSPRIERIKQKFMNDAELKQLPAADNLPGMHLIWSAKEALFKYHPEPAFDFRTELLIDQVLPDHMEARIVRNKTQESIRVPYHWQDDYVLAWTEKP